MNSTDGLSAHNLNWLYRQLSKAYGDLGWWPAKSRFEIVIGAVLVQNTAWGNVEKAIANLQEQDWLNPESIHELRAELLAETIRPAGYFNVKAKRLKNLCEWWLSQGGFEALEARPTEELRAGLLSVSGVGPETADDILLYVFMRPVFVIDAYTRRLLIRLGWLAGVPSYESLSRVLERTLPQDSALFGQYHALIVEHAKQYCRKRPICADCPLRPRCNLGLNA